MSGIEESLVKQAKQHKQPIPEKIKNKPILKSYLALYYDSFLELQFDRKENGFIPWSVIVNYADRYNFSYEQTERLIYLTHKLDETNKKWLKRHKNGQNSS